MKRSVLAAFAALALAGRMEAARLARAAADGDSLGPSWDAGLKGNW